MLETTIGDRVNLVLDDAMGFDTIGRWLLHTGVKPEYRALQAMRVLLRSQTDEKLTAQILLTGTDTDPQKIVCNGIVSEHKRDAAAPPIGIEVNTPILPEHLEFLLQQEKWTVHGCRLVEPGDRMWARFFPAMLSAIKKLNLTDVDYVEYFEAFCDDVVTRKTTPFVVLQPTIAAMLKATDVKVVFRDSEKTIMPSSYTYADCIKIDSKNPENIVGVVHVDEFIKRSLDMLDKYADDDDSEEPKPLPLSMIQFPSTPIADLQQGATGGVSLVVQKQLDRLFEL